jgi:hypothetical protein
MITLTFLAAIASIALGWFAIASASGAHDLGWDD